MAILRNITKPRRWRINVSIDTPQEFIRAAGIIGESEIFGPSTKQFILIEGQSMSISGTLSEIHKKFDEIELSSIRNMHAQFYRDKTSTGKSTNRYSFLVSLKVLDGEMLVAAKGLDSKTYSTIASMLRSYLPVASKAKKAPRGMTRNAKPHEKKALAKKMPITSASERISSHGNWRHGSIVDCYRLIRILGSGYSSEVWEAEVTNALDGLGLRIGEKVALKLYMPHVLRDRINSIRIQREFHIASEIVHPNIARVYDLVISPSRGHSFIAMQLVGGDTLRSRIPKNGMPHDDIVNIGLQIFSALEELHARRALHRDVKPANIMVTSPLGSPSEIVLLDLGIVSIDSEPSMTNTSIFLGSKHSAPIEQLIGGEIDQRTDVYAAGATLYHCFTGEPAYFREGPEGAIVKKMLSDPIKIAKNGANSLESRLIKFINRCIRVESSERFASARECIGELEKIAR